MIINAAAEHERSVAANCLKAYFLTVLSDNNCEKVTLYKDLLIFLHIRIV